MILDMLVRGGPVMWPLVFASVLGLALILDRLVTLAISYQRFHPVVNALRPLVLKRAWSQAEAWCRRRGPYTLFASVYLQQRDQPEKIRQEILKREGTVIVAHLDKRLRWLAALAQISTLLGLLGTFYFMIYRFRPEVTATGQIPQSEFYAAIWESFLSTMFGLIIATPCLLAYHVFEARVEAVARDLNILLSYLDEWCRVAEYNSANEAMLPKLEEIRQAHR